MYLIIEYQIIGIYKEDKDYRIYCLLSIMLLNKIDINLGTYWFFMITYRMIIEKARYMNKGVTWKHAGQ